MSQTKAQLIDNLVQPITGAAGSASAPTFSFTADPNTGLYSPGADQLALSTNGTGRLFVDASGNVGVAKSNPRTNLDVAGNIYMNGNTQIQIATAANTAGLQIIGQDSAESFIGTMSAQALVLRTASQERLRITSGGLVGVGTSSPASLLTSYAGNVSTLGAKASTGLLIENNGNVGNVSQIGLGYTFSSTNHPIAIAAVTTSGAGSTRADLVFAIRDLTTDVAPTERMRLDSSGRLGIGTTGPNAALDVAVARSTTVDSAIFGTTGTGVVADVNRILIKNVNTLGGQNQGVGIGGVLAASASNEAHLTFYSNPGSGVTERARINSSGNLCIGRTNGSNSISLVGNIEYRSSEQNTTNDSYDTRLRSIAHQYTNLSTSAVAMTARLGSNGFMAFVSLQNVDSDQGTCIITMGRENGIAHRYSFVTGSNANCNVTEVSEGVFEMSGLGDGRTYTITFSTGSANDPVTLKASSSTTGTTILVISVLQTFI